MSGAIDFRWTVGAYLGDASARVDERLEFAFALSV